MTDEPTVWKIAIKDEIRAFLGTNPEPDWAETPAIRDWYLTKMLHRPREDYVVEEVPGPISRAIHDEAERWEKARAEILKNPSRATGSEPSTRPRRDARPATNAAPAARGAADA